MMEYTSGTKIYAGTGAAAVLKTMGIRRLMLVTDPYFRDNGTALQIAQQAQPEAFEIFADVRPDPTAVQAAEGTAAVKTFGPDAIVALGGGSAMDCAKAMAYFAGVRRLIAIPTTSGSGSEVTDFAILTHGGTKHPLVDPMLRPEAAILDDALLRELPASLVADAGFDVLTHAMEAYVAANSSPITDALARDAFCAAFRLLPASFGGDTSVRLRVHIAATMAGMAFTQAGLGLCHGLAHALGGTFHVPHGRLNAILLPAVLEVNASAGGKYAELARSAGLEGRADTVALRNLKNALIRLRRELKLPDTLAQTGVDLRLLQQRREEIVKAALADPCCRTNPVPVTADAVVQILQEVAGRE